MSDMNQCDQSDNADEPMMPAETLRERVASDAKLWKQAFEEGMKSARNEALASVNALLAEYEKDDRDHLRDMDQLRAGRLTFQDITTNPLTDEEYLVRRYGDADKAREFWGLTDE